jgi:hypothetical protein
MLTVAAFSVRQPPPNALGFLFSQTQLSTDSAKVLRAGHTKARQAYPDDPDIAKMNAGYRSFHHSMSCRRDRTQPL